MKIAIVSEDNVGLKGTVSHHFGIAPYLTIIDSESLDVIDIIENKNHHYGGELSPPKFIKKQGIDILIVKELGENAVKSLNRLKIKVYLGAKGTIQETIKAFKENKLHQATLDDPKIHHYSPEKKS
ncbi:MAG: NifB/NifX family molybdenum-iron cluster-binding protein [Asgard group archaeon]|nr:NifB/NifX family molybdenum-iron cluster-binding protein [Asgard group archaeon]